MSNNLQWPPGGGATGALIRDFDWAKTSLGAIARWPQSLRTTVEMILNSPVPMVLMWGVDHVMIYNDDYGLIAGARHPAALGGTVPGIWPEVWDWNRPILEAGLRGEVRNYTEQHLVLERSGVPEDVWFDLSYSPVPDERGAVNGVQCTVIDVTERFLAKRRHEQSEEELRLLNATLQAEREAAKDANRRLVAETGFLRALFEQAPSFMAVLRGPDHVFELANAPYLHFVGDRDIIGKPIRAALPEVAEQGFFDILDRVYRSGEPFVGKGTRVLLQTGAAGLLRERIVDFVFQPIRSVEGAVAGIFIEGMDITERFLADERLRIAQKAGGIGTFEWFPATGKLVVSDEYRRIWGFSPEDEIDDTLLVSLIHPDDRHVTAPARLATANPLEYAEYRITRPDNGEVRWIARRGEMIGADERTPKRFVGVAFDITQRKRTEEALRDTNQRLSGLFRQTAVGVCQTDLAGTIELVNDRFCEILGRPREDVLGKRMLALTHADDREHNAAMFSEMLSTGAPFFIEQRYLRADASPVWVNNHVSLARDGAGAPQYVSAIVVDVTNRKLAEAAVLESEAQFRSLTEAVPLHVWAADPDGMLYWFNARVYEGTGYARGTLNGAGWGNVVHPDDLPGAAEAWQRAVRDGAVYAVEFRIWSAAHDAYRWFLVRALPVRDESGCILRWIGTNTDVEDQKAAARELALLNATLEQRVAEEVAQRSKTEDALRQAQKMEAVGQLTGGIAHDFNNLLQGIVGSLELIRKLVALGRVDEVERFVKSAMASSQRAAALTHRLLAFSRRQPLDPKPVHANRLVASMEDLLRRTLGVSIGIEFVLAGGLWMTKCDTNQLENAILNLVINARDAMPDGGKLTIETANAELDSTYAARHGEVAAGQYVCIGVTDTGTGMPSDVVARAFDPFFTTKPTGQGTGLGLSMIYGFARQSEGTANIYSAVGKGTTIKLYLPRFRGEAAEEEAPVDEARDHQASAGEVVLVVEDEPVVRALILEVIEGFGYRTVEAADGAAALKILDSGTRIDLLVTDIGLPGLNGRQVADAARVRRPDLKVLFMTGYAENAAFANGFLEPGMGMLTKPFAMETLAARIEEMIADPKQALGR